MKALAHPRRAMIFRLLAQDPGAGRGFRRLADRTRLRDSSLAHHLREMERGGLLRRHRRGAEVVFSLSVTELTQALAIALRLGEASRSSGPQRAA
ncbi:helix-turn-helix domain-containing protein [Sinisalibacter aestuarii]|nr:helix-turn-helix domain-containing protein [Sinisalibacter aestuarii]